MIVGMDGDAQKAVIALGFALLGLFGRDNADDSYFDQAAELGSSEPVVVTLDRTWRGKSVSEMAAPSRVRSSMKSCRWGTGCFSCCQSALSGPA